MQIVCPQALMDSMGKQQGNAEVPTEREARRRLSDLQR